MLQILAEVCDSYPRAVTQSMERKGCKGAGGGGGQGRGVQRAWDWLGLGLGDGVTGAGKDREETRVS